MVTKRPCASTVATEGSRLRYATESPEEATASSCRLSDVNCRVSFSCVHCIFCGTASCTVYNLVSRWLAATTRSNFGLLKSSVISAPTCISVSPTYNFAAGEISFTTTVICCASNAFADVSCAGSTSISAGESIATSSFNPGFFAFGNEIFVIEHALDRSFTTFTFNDCTRFTPKRSCFSAVKRSVCSALAVKSNVCSAVISALLKNTFVPTQSRTNWSLT